MEYQTIIYDVKDEIGFVTFNRPESMNAMNRQMTQELVEVCRQIEEDAAIRIGIFTGAGEKAFSAGMDLKERAETVFSPIERRNQKLTNKIYTQARAVAAYQESVRLAQVRFWGGLASYFEVLDAQQLLFPSELRLAQLDLARLTAFVQLYRALGGGWSLDQTPASAPPPTP